MAKCSEYFFITVGSGVIYLMALILPPYCVMFELLRVI